MLALYPDDISIRIESAQVLTFHGIDCCYRTT